MQVLKRYLNSLEPSDQEQFALQCATTIGYLRKAMSAHQRIGESIAIAIEKQSKGAVRCEDVRPDVDWKFLRNTA